MTQRKSGMSKFTAIFIAAIITVLSVVGLYVQTGYFRYTDAGWGSTTTVDGSMIQLQNANFVSEFQTITQSGALVYDPNNNMIYVPTGSGSKGAIQVMSDTNHSVVATISFPEGVPSVLLFDDTYSNLYAYDSSLGDKVFVINPDTYAITGNISTGVSGSIGGAAYYPIGQDIYIAGGSTNSLIILSATTDSIYQTVRIPGNPTFITYNQNNGYIYVQSGASGASSRSSAVTIVSPLALIPAVSNTIVNTLRFPAESAGLCFDQETGDVYALMSNPAAINEINSTNNKPLSTIFLPSSISSVGVSSIVYDGPKDLLLIATHNSSILEFDSSTNTFLKGYSLPSFNYLSINSANGFVYASSTSVVRVLAPSR